MNDQRRRLILVVLMLFAAAVLLGGCGNSNKKSTTPASASGQTAAAVGMRTCTTCHTEVTADWLTSLHANVSADDGLNSAGSPTMGQIVSACATNCHDPNGDSSSLSAGYTGNVARPVVGCEACHGGGSEHAGSGPIARNGWAAASTGRSPQFNTCTACHELLDSSGTTTNPSPAHLATAPTGTQYTITDTHFATPGSWPTSTWLNQNVITGYQMDYAKETVCTDCHNPHKQTTDLMREWALSAHADKTVNNYRVPLPATIDPLGYFSGAWGIYNWAQRQSCQRCHTTTGFAAYADALRTGNTALAESLRLGTLASSPVTSTPNYVPEMLKCNGCHTDNNGTVRNPGAITANYDVTVYAKVSYTFPDVSNSNLCMACHTGRENGESIKQLNLQTGMSSFDFKNQSFVSSHYLTAGATMFTVSGYEFSGRSYENMTTYLHDKIGSSVAPRTGSSGPCIGCHMSRPNKNGNHLFLPVSRSTSTLTAGTFTGIASEVCIICHITSNTVLLEIVNEQREQFHEALEALNDRLTVRGYVFSPINPYFFNAIAPVDATYVEQDQTVHCQKNLPIRNWQTGASVTYKVSVSASGNWSCVTDQTLNAGVDGTGKNNMGAAFNYNLLEHDPGAFVHNRMYVKRLIYDSIDWLDDNVMNYSTGATLNSLCTGATPPAYCVKAQAYLLPNGILGIAAERP